MVRNTAKTHHVKVTSARPQQITFLTREWWELITRINSLFGVQVDGNNESVKTQHLSENEDQNHSHKETGLLGRASDTGIADDTYGKSGGQPAETYGEPRAQVDKPPANKHYMISPIWW